jgi:hypothetical protein
MKDISRKPEQGFIEYDTFFKLISFYLPVPALRDNKNFVNWLRNTEGLPDEYATEIEYVLPQPRQSHYQAEFKEMRFQITSRLQKLEAILGHYPIQITSKILDRIKDLEMGILVIALIFNLIKALLVLISVVIIYSLLMVSIESKQFDMAVIRMVGL